MRNLLESRWGQMSLALAIGLCNAALLLGWDVINPSNVAWLTGDNASHYLGWAFYRHESSWTFPLTWTGRVGYPVGASIALFDSIALISVLLRPFESLLPEPFQYLGLYACLCFVLQAYFGFRLCGRLFPGQVTFIVLGGVFFLLSPPLTWQLFGHYPHLGHWLVLAGLNCYFRDTHALPPGAWLARHWVVLAVAGGVNPYLAVMCFLITLAGLARLLLERRCGWRTAAILFALTSTVLAGSLLLFGFLVAQDPTTYRAPGYGRLSFNLLAPINPMAFGSILLPALPITDNGQFEGYNYLGLGIIAILVAALAVRPRLMLWVRDPRLLPLAGLAIVCTAAAASSTVTLGSLTLLHIELPRAFGVLTESMRISGRLFWPAHYLLIAAALSATFHAWKPPYRAAILAAALALQLADLGPLRARVQAIGRQLGPDPLQSDAWKQLGRAHENLIVVPAFQCAPDLTPGGHPGFEVFGKLASAQRMRTNSYYAARYTQREMLVHCVDLPRAVLTDALDSRSAYVVSDGVRTLLELSSMASHRCETYDGYHLCTATASPAEADRRLPDAVPYAFGEQLDFTTEGNARKYMTHGWATVPLVDGTWTVGPVAALLLGIEDTATDSLLLTAELRGFVTDAHRRLDADVVVNGQTVERWTFRQGRLDTKRSARIPASVIGGRRALDVQFRVLNPQAPAYVGEGYDFRFVGLNIRGLVLHREP